MEEMGSLWSYQESVDELKQKLLYTTLELESVRVEANEEMRKSKENVNQLIQLVKIACQERDEARNQLQKLLNRLLPSSATPPTKFFANPPQLSHETSHVKPTKPNSSIAESNSLSEPYNYHSHSSSPVNSFFEPVSSPELSNIIGDSGNVTFVGSPFVNATVSNMVYSAVPKFDQDSLVIDSLVEGKTLPQQGKLLQAVLEAGPLLQTLLVAGPLPRWRNPPPLEALHIPPVSIKGFSAETVDHKPTMCGPHGAVEQNSRCATHVGKSRPFVEMSCGLNFANGTSGSYLGNGRLVPAGTGMNSYIPNGKRQRFQ